MWSSSFQGTVEQSRRVLWLKEKKRGIIWGNPAFIFFLQESKRQGKQKATKNNLSRKDQWNTKNHQQQTNNIDINIEHKNAAQKKGKHLSSHPLFPSTLSLHRLFNFPISFFLFFLHVSHNLYLSLCFFLFLYFCSSNNRWYGGIPLSADRFKHINNAARLLLDECGYIPSSGSGTTEDAAGSGKKKLSKPNKKAGKR